jgi:putative cell wall-binding protein
LTELGGANRYETNTAVAEELVKLGVSASDVLVVGGEGFSDALSVAPVAAAKGQILLLANNNSSQPAIDFVKENNSKVTVVGTSNVINDTVYNALGATTRVDGGTDRFDTNLKVLDNFKDSLKTDKLYIANATAATPDDLYADALVASAVAGKYSAPLVLVDTETSDATTKAIAYIGNNGKTSDVQLIGGTGVVSANTETAINNALKGDNPNPGQGTEVQSIEATSLNQIKVVFNGEVDSDTAEEVSNYKVDGTALNDKGTSDNIDEKADENSAKAVLQDDNKTVLITLSDSKKQSDDVDVTVKKGILSEDKSQSIDEFTQTVNFEDTTAPTLDSVEARGNKKLAVEFSEPVNLGKITPNGTFVTSNSSSITSKLKINDKSITSFGLDTDYSEVKDYIIDSDGYVWSSKVDFYFDSALPTGNNTFKVETGDKNKLDDAAGFPIQEDEVNFDVDTQTGAPQISSITAEDNGKVYVNFDRPMDAKTALKDSNYEINGTELKLTGDSSNASKIEFKKDDTQVKISGVSSLINKNSNTLYVDDNVKDAYGNNIADDTRESFTLDEDDTKPEVESIYALDDDTIRVRFNKDVNVNFAQNTSNYTLRDNSGTDITNDDKKGIDTITNPSNSKDSANVFDINVKGKLTDSQYTLKIKNIRDTASTPNIIEEKTYTFDGASDVAPKVVGAYKVASGEDSQRKVVVKFNKEMDASSLDDLDNYKFINGSDDTKSLPSDTDITPSNDNKSVTIKFPSSYATSGKSGDNLIKQIAVTTGVKDVNGNALEVGYTSSPDGFSDSSENSIIENSVKVTYSDDNSGKDLEVQFKPETQIDTVNKNNFTVNGVTPSSATLSGDVVKLVFTDGDDATQDDITNSGYVDATKGSYTPSKIQAVKFTGINAVVKVNEITDTDKYGDNTVDVTGGALDYTQTATAYDYIAQPKTIRQAWNAGTTTDGKGYVDIVFDTPIDVNSGVATDDFSFTTNAGKDLDVDHVEIGSGIKSDVPGNAANTVRFIFSDASQFTSGTKIYVNANSSASIRTVKDKNDFNAVYTPSDKDLQQRTITVGTPGAQE